MQIKLIGASIDKCASVRGAADTPDIIAPLLEDLDLKIKDIVYYNDGRHDLNKLESYFTNIANLVNATLVSKNFPIVIGGDHSCAIATWSGVSCYLTRKNLTLGLIWVDAHMDAHTPQTTLSGNIHGMPIATLMGYGYDELVNLLSNGSKLDPKNLVMIGTRSYEEGEAELLKRLGVRVYFSSDIEKRGFAQVFQEAWEYISNRTTKIGLSIDVDGFDPEFTPGVATTEPNGINFNEFMDQLSKIDSTQLIAVELAEANPRLDDENKTVNCLVDIIRTIQKKI